MPIDNLDGYRDSTSCKEAIPPFEKWVAKREGKEKLTASVPLWFRDTYSRLNNEIRPFHSD